MTHAATTPSGPGLPTATLGRSPITPPASSKACGPLLGLGVLFAPYGADTGLWFPSLHGPQPCSSSFCYYLSMQMSVIPCLQFVLHLSLGAGSSWSGCPEMGFDPTPLCCRPFHSSCIQTSPLALCAHPSHHSHQTSLQVSTTETCSHLLQFWLGHSLHNIP